MTLAEARDTFAAALSTVDGVRVRSHGPVADPVHGDGWVVARTIVPSRFRGQAQATLGAVVILGPDQNAADRAVDELAVPLMHATEQAPDLLGGQIAVEPILLPAGITGEPLYALDITVTVETE